MIFIKERTKPIYLLKLEAALRRVPDTHPNKQKILKEYLKHQSGYRGEKTVDYYLSLLPKEQTILLPNLRLKNNNFHFQMDTLVLTPRFFLIIESKNSAGELIYDTDTNELVKRLGRILIKRDQPYNPNVLEKFDVKKEELICGIHCPSCFNFNMRKSRQGHWKCETCSFISKEAFRFSINDYLLLVNNVIKNSEFRRFLDIKASRSAVRLLSNYKKTGNKKATTYQLTYYKS